jgi:hypothetical protein
MARIVRETLFAISELFNDPELLLLYLLQKTSLGLDFLRNVYA